MMKNPFLLKKRKGFFCLVCLFQIFIQLFHNRSAAMLLPFYDCLVKAFFIDFPENKFECGVIDDFLQFCSPVHLCGGIQRFGRILDCDCPVVLLKLFIFGAQWIFSAF